ncbi:MAG: anti-sigma factor family protein [Candidatus Aminicenantales bacterium]
MSCLHLDQIYLYLEEQLPASEIKKIEAHLASCPKCQQAVADRKLLDYACQTLPLLKTPSDFSSQVMARIFPTKTKLWLGLTAAAASFLSFILTITLYFIFTDKNLISLLTSSVHAGLKAVEKASIFLIKSAKLILLLGKTSFQFVVFLIDSLARLMKIVSPEGQIILILLAFILFTSLYWGIKKTLLPGEKA